jgi:hypothetical protein
MKALGVLESKWDPIRKKLVRLLLEEQDKVLCYGPTSHQNEGRGARGRTGATYDCKGREHVQHVRVKMKMGHIHVKMACTDLGRVLNASGGSVEIGVFLFVFYFRWFS